MQESGRIKPSRLPHIRMSIRNYVGALGCLSARDCSQEVFAIDKFERDRAIEDYLVGQKSPHLLRNTKNDISFLMRHAEELNFIELPAQTLVNTSSTNLGKRKLGRSLPRKVLPSRIGFHREPYGLALDKWDDHIREQYNDWREWVSVGKAIVNDIKPFNRPATVENKTRKLEAYFGYLFNIRGIHELDFRMLLDVSGEILTESKAKTDFAAQRRNSEFGLLEEFISWHRERNDDKDSFQASGILSVAAGVAQKYYFPKALLDEQYAEAEKYNRIAVKINYLQRRLNQRLQHDKIISGRFEQRVTAEELRLAASKEFPRSPLLATQPGTVIAQTAGRALAIMLLVNYPLRNVNYREARLEQHLLKNASGGWILRFTGDGESASLKSKDRLNKQNIYERIIEPETATLLDAYISEWRPRLLRQIDDRILQNEAANLDSGKDIEILNQHKKHLFLNSRGIPFSRQGFSIWIEKGIYRWLGVRISPEKIRRISVAEMLKKGKTEREIADQINDVPESIARIKSSCL